MRLAETNTHNKKETIMEIRNDGGNAPAPVKKQRMFAHPFSFRGRIRRLEFGLSAIIYSACMYLITVIDGEFRDPLRFLVAIAAIWFMLAQQIKRFHDRDGAGWNIFTLLIPIYGWIVIYMQLFEDGDPCENNYGPDPKGRDIYADVAEEESGEVEE